MVLVSYIYSINARHLPVRLNVLEWSYPPAKACAPTRIHLLHCICQTSVTFNPFMEDLYFISRVSSPGDQYRY